MLSNHVVRQIQQLLEKGEWSQRRIADHLCVSRGSVGAIAAGKRPDYEAIKRERDKGFIAPSGPPKRCERCGVLVCMPCLACQIAAMQQREREDSGKPRSLAKQPSR